MAKEDNVMMFLAGLGVGAAVGILLAPRSGDELRAQLGEGAAKAGDFVKTRAGSLSDSVGDVVAQGKQMWNEGTAQGRSAMSDIKDKIKDKIDDAADATKRASDKVVDKSKDAAHEAGKKLQDGGQRLQDA